MHSRKALRETRRAFDYRVMMKMAESSPLIRVRAFDNPQDLERRRRPIKDEKRARSAGYYLVQYDMKSLVGRGRFRKGFDVTFDLISQGTYPEGSRHDSLQAGGINRAVAMSQNLKSSSRALVLDTYAELDTYIRAFGAGHLGLLIVIGSPGLQKSTVIKQCPPDYVCWFEGNATAFALYCRVYEHRNCSVVIDDADDLYADKARIRLLKSLCQTTAFKTVRWDSDASTLKVRGIPIPRIPANTLGSREFQQRTAVCALLSFGTDFW